jgi:hypothetical protein
LDGLENLVPKDVIVQTLRDVMEALGNVRHLYVYPGGQGLLAMKVKYSI